MSCSPLLLIFYQIVPFLTLVAAFVRVARKPDVRQDRDVGLALLAATVLGFVAVLLIAFWHDDAVCRTTQVMAAIEVVLTLYAHYTLSRRAT